jgi:hypothetical protein
MTNTQQKHRVKSLSEILLIPLRGDKWNLTHSFASAFGSLGGIRFLMERRILSLQ